MIRAIKKDIYNNLKHHPARLLHVNAVMLVASNLAITYNVDENDVVIAALGHDYAKYANKAFFNKYISIDDLKLYSNATVNYHAIGAANYFKKHYKINSDVYNAIYYHVFGRPKMSMLEKIVFVSDSIYLNGINNTQALYKLALKDIDKAVYMAIDMAIKELKEKNLNPHKDQIATYNYYKEVI